MLLHHLVGTEPIFYSRMQSLFSVDPFSTTIDNTNLTPKHNESVMMIYIHLVRLQIIH